jgi:antitoxin YefM
MGHVNFTEFRANMAKHLDKVEEDRDQLIITRQGHEPLVVMTLDDFRGLEETLHLLGSTANRDMLLASIAELDAGRVVEVDPATLKPLR